MRILSDVASVQTAITFSHCDWVRKVRHRRFPSP
jgi:hypothetical protein